MNIKNTISAKEKTETKWPATGVRLLKTLGRGINEIPPKEPRLVNSVIEFCELTYDQALREFEALISAAAETARDLSCEWCFDQKCPTSAITAISLLAGDPKPVKDRSAIAAVIVECKEIPKVLCQLNDGTEVAIGLGEIGHLRHSQFEHPEFQNLFSFLLNWRYSIRTLWSTRLVNRIGRLLIRDGPRALGDGKSNTALVSRLDPREEQSFYEPWEGRLREEINLPDFSDEDVENIGKLLCSAAFGSEICEIRPIDALHQWLKQHRVQELLRYGLTPEEVVILIRATESRLGPEIVVRLEFDPEKGRFNPYFLINDHRGEGGHLVKLAEIPHPILVDFFSQTEELFKEDLFRLVLREHKRKAEWLILEAEEH